LSSFVPATVSLDFVLPEFIFHLVFPPGKLPAVPEIPIQEDANFFFLENNVGGSADGFDVGFEFAGRGFFEEAKEGFL